MARRRRSKIPRPGDGARLPSSRAAPARTLSINLESSLKVRLYYAETTAWAIAAASAADGAKTSAVRTPFRAKARSRAAPNAAPT